MQNSKISVIIPVYNVEKYLKQCLDSVISQSYSNLEIILINDGSNDSSLSICREYEIIDERVVVINKKNGGLSDARNVGLDIATGNYIFFLDSDDFLDKKLLELLINQFSLFDIDIAMCSFTSFTDGTSDAKLPINKKCKSHIYRNKDESLKALYSKKNNINNVVWNKLYKKNLFDTIRFPVGKINEDMFTTYKLLFEAKGVLSINYPGYFYRVRKNSIMGQFSVKRFDVFDAFTEAKIFYQKKEMSLYEQMVLEQAMKKAMVFYSMLDGKFKEKSLDIYKGLYSDYLKLNCKRKIIFTFYNRGFNFFSKILQIYITIKNKGRF